MLDVTEQLRRYAEAAEAATVSSFRDETRQRPLRRGLLVGAAAAVVLLVLGILALGSSPEQRVLSGDGGSDRSQGEWSEFPEAPIPARMGAAVTTTDAELIVWGGWNETALADGAAFTYTRGTWRTLPPSPLSPRAYPLVAWTDHEMIVWGGTDSRFPNEGRVLEDGAAYDPSTDTWRMLPSAGVGGRQGSAAAVWTGEEVVVVGTKPSSRVGASDTWAYDPRSDQWRELSPMPAGHGYVQAAIWTDGELLLVTAGVSVAHLDPRSGTWSGPIRAPVPGTDVDPEGIVWSGDRLFVISHYRPGALYDPARRSMTELPASMSQMRFPAVEVGGVIGVGDRWLDPAALEWHDMAPPPPPVREFPYAVAHQGRLYVWGGDACGPGALCSRLVDPKIGLIWTPPPTSARS